MNLWEESRSEWQRPLPVIPCPSVHEPHCPSHQAPAHPAYGLLLAPCFTKLRVGLVVSTHLVYSRASGLQLFNCYPRGLPASLSVPVLSHQPTAPVPWSTGLNHRYDILNRQHSHTRWTSCRFGVSHGKLFGTPPSFLGAFSPPALFFGLPNNPTHASLCPSFPADTHRPLTSLDFPTFPPARASAWNARLIFCW